MAEKHDPLADCEGFEWDEANLDKNWQSHRVAFWECEEIFFNQPLIVREDPAHSNAEARYFALGQTDTARLLFVAFTVRNRRIRPISFREMNPREQRHYEEAVKKDS